MTPSLIIAGREVSLVSILDYQQQISPIVGGTRRRLANGALFAVNHYRKLKITISGRGWVPPAIAAVNYDGAFEVELPQPMALKTGDTLPAGVTSRAAPWAEHTVVDQAAVSTRYVYPKLIVMSDGPTFSGDSSAEFSWELVLEQI